MTPQLQTRYVFTITANIGEVRGEGISGKVCAFGADFQIIRTVPKFETGHPKYRWLMEHLFIGSARHADRVVIEILIEGPILRLADAGSVSDVVDWSAILIDLRKACDMLFRFANARLPPLYSQGRSGQTTDAANG